MEKDMKSQKAFTSVELLVVIIAVVVIGSWMWNAAKLMSCDFKSDYKCEVIHGIGVFVPPISIVTTWFGDDGT